MSSSIKILIVDDNITMRHALLFQLDRLGVKSDAVTNGLEALQRVQICRYDLILMDIQMPDMNGLEATSAIRGYERAEGLDPVPIIAVTDGGASRQECMDTGMTDCLQRPVFADTLTKVLEKFLPKERLGGLP